MRRAVRVAAWGAVLAMGSGLLALAPVTTAWSHEEVPLGPVEFEIGFQNEPAYAGFQNAVFLSIHHANDKAVTNAADTLKVAVEFGSQRMDVPLEPNFQADEGGEPGQYLAHFIPTRPGPYTFHLTGSIAGQKIDERFTSSETTFDEVVDPTSVQFPVKDPTLGQIAERLDRGFPRLEQAAADARDAADTAASTARTIAIVALALGAAGLAFGLIAFSRSRRAGASKG